MNYVICAHNIGREIEQNLIKCGVTPVKIRGFDKFGNVHPLSYHPDMFCFNLQGKKWIFYENILIKNKSVIDRLEIEAVPERDPASCEYPHDVGLNAAMFGGNLICNVRYTSQKIIEYAEKLNKNIIDVKQGYSKCSVCIVDENSIITSDASICEGAARNNVNVLFIEKGHINLGGYNYGFIGGCSGLTDKNRLVFTGDITLHPDYENIEKFCRGRGVEITSLSAGRLRDYGSLLRM